MVLMNLIYGLSAYPFGKLSDSMTHTRLLNAGMMVLVLADVVLAMGTHWANILIGVSLWGLHMGMTQGLLAAMVAHTAPPDLRGTAYGFFNLVSGIGMLFASIFAGLLWDKYGASYTFYAGAGFCLVALGILRFYQVIGHDNQRNALGRAK